MRAKNVSVAPAYDDVDKKTFLSVKCVESLMTMSIKIEIN